MVGLFFRQLQHPHLVQLYGVSTTRRPLYLITEYMKHGQLTWYNVVIVVLGVPKIHKMLPVDLYLICGQNNTQRSLLLLPNISSPIGSGFASRCDIYQWAIN